MTGSSVLTYQKPTGKIWRYTGTHNWLGGLCFPIASWKKFKFGNFRIGTDTQWQLRFPLNTRYDLQDATLMLCRIHPHNSSPKPTTGKQWRA